VQDRYIATLLPTLVIWLGLGTYELGVWLRDSAENLLSARMASARVDRLLLALPTLLVALFFAVLQPRVIAQYTNIGSFRPEHKTFGLYVRDKIPPDSVIMSRYPAIAFYAEAQWEPTPNAEFGELLLYARAQHVDYFVLDEEETLQLRPQLAFLFEDDRVPPELQALYFLDSARGRLALFELQRER
jgi:hypothetical protein